MAWEDSFPLSAYRPGFKVYCLAKCKLRMECGGNAFLSHVKLAKKKLLELL
jgi:hypothetical protein